MKNWILAIRPKTLLASIAPVLLGLTVAYAETKSINFLAALFTLICALSLQIASNLANDYLDSNKGVDTKNRLGPIRVTSSGLIPAEKMKKGLILALLVALIFGIYLMYLGGPIIIIIGLVSLYCAYGYTGGPMPLSYNGLGEIAAFTFFGPVAVFGTSYIQTHQVTTLSLVTGMGPGFISACILAINNLRDIMTDKDAKKITLAVRFGEPFQRKLCIFMIGMSIVIPLYLLANYNFKWILPVLFLPMFFKKTWFEILYKPIGPHLNLSLARTAQYNFLYCLFISAGIILSLKI